MKKWQLATVTAVAVWALVKTDLQGTPPASSTVSTYPQEVQCYQALQKYYVDHMPVNYRLACVSQ